MAFVHTRHEIMARVRWLKDNPEQVMLTVESTMHRLFAKSNVSPKETIGFFKGRVEEPPPTGLAQNPLVLMRKPDVVLGWIQAATTVALTEAFTKLKLDADSTLPGTTLALSRYPRKGWACFIWRKMKKG